MDCLTARHDLECVRPGSDDEAIPELAPAAAHVQSCPACQAVLQQQRRIDRQIGAMCRDVPVPAGLKNRIFAALEHAAVEGVSQPVPSWPATAQPEPDRRSSGRRDLGRRDLGRRAVLRVFVTVAACLAVCAFVGQWILRPAGPRLLVESVEETTRRDFGSSASLPLFTGDLVAGVSPQLPRRMDIPRSLAKASPQLMMVDGQRAAAYFFSFGNRNVSERRSRLLDGCLVVVPRSVLKGLPAQDRQLSEYRYNGELVTTTWFEGNLAYVCFVRGGASDLDQLFRQHAS